LSKIVSYFDYISLFFYLSYYISFVYPILFNFVISFAVYVNQILGQFIGLRVNAIDSLFKAFR